MWYYLGGLALEEVKSVDKKIRGKESAITQHKRDEAAARESYARVDCEIKTKEGQVTSVQPTITKINNAVFFSAAKQKRLRYFISYTYYFTSFLHL